MIARLLILLPFSFTISKDDKFIIIDRQKADCKIRYYPPVRLQESSEGVPDVDEISVNGKQALSANCLKIDFIKTEFNLARNLNCDPSFEFIEEAANFFLLRARHITQGIKIRPIEISKATWHLTYLHDNETELEPNKDKVRVRGSKVFSVTYTALTPEIWNDIFNSKDSDIPDWSSIMLDSISALPEIGPSIAMAATALEIFISKILNTLHAESNIPSQLWQWINERNNRWWQEPSFADKFDVLLHAVGGFTLKDNEHLWKIFKDLKDARNSFVHEGIAEVNDRKINSDEARRLVFGSKEIIDFIRRKIPEKFQWRNFEYKVEVSLTKNIKF